MLSTQKILLSITIIIFFFSCNNENINTEIGKTPIVTTDTTLSHLNEKLKSNPNNPDLYHERAKYFLEKKDIDAAMADMARVLKLDSSKSDYFTTLADLYFTQGMGGSVKKALEKSISLEPANTAAIIKLAELHLYLKNYKECLGNLDNALKIDKYNAKIYFLKGMVFKETRDTAKAVSSFQTTVEQDTDYYDAYMQLGLLYSIRHSKLAMDYFRSAIKINPKNIEAYYGLAMFAQENGAYENAIEVYNSILQIDSTYQFAHYNLGYINSEYLKNYKNAITNFSNAIKNDTTYFEAYYMRGLCYERMKDFKNAEVQYQLSLKIKPDWTLAAEGMSRIKG